METVDITDNSGAPCGFLMQIGGQMFTILLVLLLASANGLRVPFFVWLLYVFGASLKFTLQIMGGGGGDG